MNRLLSIRMVPTLVACLGAAACSPAADDAARSPAAGGTEAPATAQAAGPSSPRDSVSASIGNATVLVDYGRPSRRGRAIFGGLVPYDAVWRTGANAATTLVLGGDVELGGQPLRAGTYTLYSLPARDGWTLIVSGQTGQWGTEYNAGRDVLRVPLETSRPPAPVDTFTIAAEGGEREGRLVFAWDTLQGAVALRAR